MQTRRSKIGLIIIFSLAVYAFYWAVSHVNFADVVKTLQRLTWQHIAILVTLNVIIWLIHSLRWKLLIAEQGHRVSLGTLLLHRCSSFAVSCFTPAPRSGGEALQAYLLHKFNDIPAAVAVTSVTQDKIINVTVTVSVFTILCAVSWHVMPVIAYIFWVLLAALSLGVWGMVSYKNGRFPLFLWLARFFPKKITNVFTQIESSMREVFFSKTWWYCLCLSFSVWAIVVFEYWLTFHFLGETMSLRQAITLLITLNFTFVMPVPGGWGTVESSQVMALKIMGLDTTVGVSVSVIVRIRDIIMSIIGFGWLHFIWVKPSDSYKLQDSEETSETETSETEPSQ